MVTLEVQMSDICQSHTRNVKCQTFVKVTLEMSDICQSHTRNVKCQTFVKVTLEMSNARKFDLIKCYTF